MEIATQSDIYTPGIDEHGNYVDKTPSFNIMKKGVLLSMRFENRQSVYK